MCTLNGHLVELRSRVKKKNLSMDFPLKSLYFGEQLFKFTPTLVILVPVYQWYYGTTYYVATGNIYCDKSPMEEQPQADFFAQILYDHAGELAYNRR